ncbi:MAG: glycosyltransferase [Lachnospiraceae bacterium]|nr:glycosyltransferase [Lachnospiraceae bacterium]
MIGDGENKEKERISIIIPCHNVEGQIDRCLKSVTGQTMGLDDVEIICVDDCSNDSTVDHLLKWEEKYPENIMVVRCDQNRRQGAARNIGLSYATGKYVTFVDADDWLEYDYLERLSAPLRFNDYDLVLANYVRDHYAGDEPIQLDAKDRGTGGSARSMLIDTDDKREIFLYLQLVPYSACYRLIKKSLLDDNNIRFIEERAYEDTAWGLETCLLVKKVYFAEEYLYHYYVKDDSTVLKKNEDYHADMLYVQEEKLNKLKHCGFFERYRNVLEFEHIRSCYLSFLKVLALRYDDPPYDLFVRLKEHIKENIPDIGDNPYIKEGLDPFQKALLDIVYVPLDEDGFRQIISAIRDHGGL